MDRAHRIGQKKEVKVFRFVTQDSIEEKVVERAEMKLQMDFAVIQSGRLAEKSKALTKEEALAAVRYGADKVFKAETDEFTGDRRPARIHCGYHTHTYVCIYIYVNIYIYIHIYVINMHLFL